MGQLPRRKCRSEALMLGNTMNKIIWIKLPISSFHKTR